MSKPQANEVSGKLNPPMTTDNNRELLPLDPEAHEAAWVAFRDSTKPAPFNAIGDAVRAYLKAARPVPVQGEEHARIIQTLEYYLSKIRQKIPKRGRGGYDINTNAERNLLLGHQNDFERAIAALSSPLQGREGYVLVRRNVAISARNLISGMADKFREAFEQDPEGWKVEACANDLTEAISAPQPVGSVQVGVEDRSLRDLAKEMDRISRGAELQARVMRDVRRTGGWEGSEKVADAFDDISERASAVASALSQAAEGCGTHNPAPEEWQPIETAPKDGSVILAYRADAGVFQAHYVSPADIFRGHPDHESDDCEPQWWTTDGDDLEGDLPTHWRPLPAPPQGEQR